MATEVVSGRVDEKVRQRADAYIRAAGSTPAEVIKVVWENIARTGEVPTGEPAKELLALGSASWSSGRAFPTQSRG